MIDINIKKASINKKKILSDIAIKIKENKITAICGPNGSGKTTLLKTILNETKLDGTIKINGLDLTNLSLKEKSKLIAYVPQKLFFANTTGYDVLLSSRFANYLFIPKNYDYQVIDQIIKDLSLSSIIFKPINQLSGGQLQLIAVARALAQETKIIIFDEPLSNLDIKTSLDVLNLLKLLVDKYHKTVIITMHDLNHVLNFADELIFLKNGTLYKQLETKLVKDIDINYIYDINLKMIEIDNQKILLKKE